MRCGESQGHMPQAKRHKISARLSGDSTANTINKGTSVDAGCAAAPEVSDAGQSSTAAGPHRQYQVEATSGRTDSATATHRLSHPRVRNGKKELHPDFWRPASESGIIEKHDSGSSGTDEQAKGEEEGALGGQLGNLGLLVLLYMLQGVPMGLTMGAMPFMLQSRLSYAQLGTFSLAAYPYSLKLLWSPIVDSLYSKRMGRRKTWIVPIQFCTAFLLLFCSGWISQLFDSADVNTLTAIFFVIVLLAATQDIAVDGWALTLLPPEHVTWAATCQTVGTSTGFFTSFTVFLALQDPNFCNKYVRSWGFLQRLGMEASSQAALVTLPGYLRFWGSFFVIVTALIWFCKPEGMETEEENLSPQDKPLQDKSSPDKSLQAAPSGTLSSALASVRLAYTALWGVVRLRAVWGLVALLLTYRLGVLAAEAAASLKLLEKGVPKETLAVLVLAQFPIELVSALLAGRWAASQSPTPPFLAAYFLRLAVNAATVALVAAFPTGAESLPLSSPLYVLLACISLCSSAVNSLAFTALGSLFNTISDPEMGGAYLTLLNTIANMGVILPKAPAFYLIDALTMHSCLPQATSAGPGNTPSAHELASLACPIHPASLTGPSDCSNAGGVCTVVRDGFYVVSWASLGLGMLFGLVYLKYLPALLRLPLSAWRAKVPMTVKQPQTQTVAARRKEA